MNDLDKKIAELKGWREPTMEEYRELVKDDRAVRNLPLTFLVPLDHAAPPPWKVTDLAPCCWSTSDAKAFELVDEICIDQPDGAGARFQLIKWNANKDIGKPARWEARIEPYWVNGEFTHTQVGHEFTGEGPTRPEAICRAYIAAREWMATKGGA